jgi:hypothetical protein
VAAPARRHDRQRLPGSSAPWPSIRTDFGIIEDVDIVRTDAANDDRVPPLPRPDHGFAGHRKDPDAEGHPQREATEVIYETMCEFYKDIMPVKKVGQTHIWFTPWDYLIRWWGIEEAMIDMIDRPDMVHAAYERMVDAWMVELDQFEEMNLLSLD